MSEHLPASSEPPQQHPAQSQGGGRSPGSMYAQGSVANMLRSLLVIAAIMSLFVLVFPRLQPQAPGIDVAETAHQVEQSTGWDVSAPGGLPEAWVPLRANYHRIADLMTWQAGFETAEGNYAAFAQTLDATDTWVEQSVARSPRLDAVEIGGASWERYDRIDGKVQRSLVQRGATGELTTVVTGTASWAELETLAGSLAPVADRS
ncbi:MAG TPA: DUF4245 domain-containing protein [Intrasporangiaceae bacterium]|nr:DUF4245 domain-containing protein [Intrasporangiaceae bacterium]